MIPRLRDRIPHLYVERSAIGVQGSAVIAKAKGAITDVPSGRLAALLLGPGVSITQEAVKQCTRDGCRILWVGAEGTHLYGAGDPLAGDAERLLQQAACVSNRMHRQRVVRFMFERRFDAPISPGLDENTVRGMEGSRVKQVYRRLATQHGITWVGRHTKDPRDPINKALNWANGHLTQAAVISVLAAGYSPALGFLHSGFNRAFACDIADLWKFQTTVPLAFELVGRGEGDRTTVRRSCRDLFRKHKLIDKMIRDSVACIDAGIRS